MPGHALLLRGINVGKHRRLAMADLRELLSGLGYTDARTLLNSGNAVFTASGSEPRAVADRIEAAIHRQLGMSVRCLVRTEHELRDVLSGNPLEEVTDGSSMMVHFLFDDPDPNQLAVADPSAIAPGQVGIGDRVVYQWCPDGLLNAPSLGPVFAQLGVETTTRNWNTVTKLAAMLG